jgi:hypothetical protein
MFNQFRWWQFFELLLDLSNGGGFHGTNVRRSLKLSAASRKQEMMHMFCLQLEA